MIMNDRIKSIKEIEINKPTICYSCGKELSIGKMWEITYFRYLDSKIEPCHCCKKCMPSKAEVIKTFGIKSNSIKNDEEQKITFRLKDLTEMFIIILKIKEQKAFDPEILNELIYEKIKNKEYQELLIDYTKKRLFITIKELIASDYLYTTIQNEKLLLYINNNIPITKIMQKNIDYLEPVINFTEEYRAKEKITIQTKPYQNTNNNIYIKKRKNV